MPKWVRGKWPENHNDAIILCVVWLRFFEIYLKCQKPVGLRYWYDAWWHGVSRQAVGSQNSGSGHYLRVALGGRIGPARRWRSDRASIRCLAPSGVRYQPDGLDQILPSGVRGAPGGFGAELMHEEGFLRSFRWCSRCNALVRGPVTSVSCIGVTRGHSRL